LNISGYGYAETSLIVDDLTFRYHRGHQTLANVTLEAEPGTTVVLGPNGAGKTTLFKIIAGVLKADHGEVRLGERRESAPTPPWRWWACRAKRMRECTHSPGA
jgi:ABC-type multidrug transport system ATPase subunit